MSVFDGLLAEVWEEARADDGALLADFAAPGRDAARAERALRLPAVQRANQRLRQHAAAFSGRGGCGEAGEPARVGGKSPERARLALARAQQAFDGHKDLDAVLASSEAIRFIAPQTLPCLLDALELRGRALLRLEQAEPSLLDLGAARALLASVHAPASPNAQHFARHLRILMDMAACMELQGDWARADALLREAMTEVRNAPADLDTAIKTEVVNDIMQRLKKVNSSVQPGKTRPRPLVSAPLASSGLDALPKLFAGPHATLAAASAALEQRADDKRGRHLIAAQNIPAGSALIVERPYAWSLALDEMATHCLHCCAPVLASVPCPHCSNAVFCGEACLRAALPAYHLVECSVLTELAVPANEVAGAPASELSPMALLAFRIVVHAAGLSAGQDAVVLPQAFVDLHQDDESCNKKRRRKAEKSLDGYGPVFAQVTHSGARTPADVLKRSLTAAFLTCCLEAGLRAGLGRAGEHVPDDVEVLTADQALLLTTAFLHHLQGCSCNAYQISEHRLPGGAVRGASAAELGGACYPTVSLVNHACCPNVVRHTHANVCVVRAARFIPKGSEVLDNYGPHFLELDVDERRAALAKQYMFQCECEACRGDWPTLSELEQFPAPEEPNRGKSNRKQGNTTDLAGGLRSAIQGLLEGRVEEALQAALKYAAVLERRGRPPCGELVRAEQVASLCWSLSGNTVRH